MQRHLHAQGLGLGRRRARTGGMLARFLWISGYLTVTFAALFSTYLFPALVFSFRSHNMYAEPYRLHKQGDLGVKSRVDGLRWTQEIAPLYLSRVSKSNLKNEQIDFYKKQADVRVRSVVDGLSWTQEIAPPHLSRVSKPKLKNGQIDLQKKLWKPPHNRGFEPCVQPGDSYNGPRESRGYLLVHSNGGLNQMRAGICDMVAVARIINATLVIPELDKRSFWQDSSNFSDVFDEEYFIKALENDVPIVRKLPKELVALPKAHKQFRSWSGVKYYEEEIALLWQEYKVIRAAKSDSRLANNDLPADIQKLRCRVHYDALRFAPPIEALGKKLVETMRSNGPYIALHLRYEKDMLAFSGCTYGLSESEAEELAIIRENTLHWKVKIINSTEQRAKGFCPLTPKEVGIFLKALGYPSSTRIYIAAGEIYGGNSNMDGLQAQFPNLMRKETIMSPEELAPFSQHASQMAALDYIVSVESDVFIPSYSGHMARAVEGHRRFLGHRKTITPDRKALVSLLNKLDHGQLHEGPRLSAIVTEIHKKRQGAPRKRKGPTPGSRGRERFRTEEVFYNNPLPECMCLRGNVTNVRKSVNKESDLKMLGLNTSTQILSMRSLQRL